MKRNLLISIMLLAMSGFLKAQVVSDFEVIKMNVMLGGDEDQSSMTVVPNPDPTGINTSNWVVKFVRDKDGVPWGGFWSVLPVPVDMTVNKYVHVKVWKPRISPLRFRLENGGPFTIENGTIFPQSTIGAWEDMVFDFTQITGAWSTIVFMPDDEDPLTLTNDIVIYFDDVMVNNDPTPNSAPAYMIENYEIIPLNLMLADPAVDSSKMTVVTNPDPTGINVSNYVVEFVRDKDGWPWDGFWSPTSVDVTTNKYMHVKVWKPIISPTKFKIEGGTAGALETTSIEPQTSTGTWEDMVFDFSTKTGVYPIISFMPDFEDPVTLTENMVMYFDDIILNNDPNPITNGFQVTMNVDMHNAGLLPGEPVYIAGSFGGTHGTWNEPGTNPANEMTDPDHDTVYSITMTLAEGIYQFKFFKGTGWNGGEWPGDPNRSIYIFNDTTANFTWGVIIPVGISEHPLANKVNVYPVPFNDALIVNTVIDLKSIIITSTLGQQVVKIENLSMGITTINTSGLAKGLYFVTFYPKSGVPYTLKILRY